MSIQEFISKNETGAYVLIGVAEGEPFPTNAIAIPSGTNAVTYDMTDGTNTFWRNGSESFNIDTNQWAVNPNYVDGGNIEVLWERDGFVWPPVDGEGTPDQGAALEYADSEFIALLETFTRKRLSEIQKKLVTNILNNQ